MLKKIISAILLAIMCYPLWILGVHFYDITQSVLPPRESSYNSGIAGWTDGIYFFYTVAVLWTAVTSIVFIIKFDRGTLLQHLHNLFFRWLSIVVDASIGAIALSLCYFINNGFGIVLTIIAGVGYVALKIGFTVASVDGDCEAYDDEANGFFWATHVWLKQCNDYREEIEERQENYDEFVRTATF